MHDWQTVHSSFQELAVRRAELDAEEAYWIREGHRVKVWTSIGCASFVEYLGLVCGYRGDTARERIRTALALGALIGQSFSGYFLCAGAGRHLRSIVDAARQRGGRVSGRAWDGLAWRFR